jgi:uncharacterized protein YlxW (UPF0749 family)
MGLLGFLVIVQLQAQSGGATLAARSTEELSVLVANLNARNDDLRAEVARLESDLAVAAADRAAGGSSVDRLRTEVGRVRAWAGVSAVGGTGVQVAVRGALRASDLADLLDELLNAGAEAIAVDDVRLVPGTAPDGAGDSLRFGGQPIGTGFAISAVGRSEVLSGSLSRVGGVLSQLRATYPDLSVVVTPLERVVVPATRRTLVPVNGTPVL